MNKLRVDIWSDIACPWCYVGKRRLEAALAGFPHRIRSRSSGARSSSIPRPRASRESSVSYAERLAKKYGTSTAQAEAMIKRMTDVATEDGLDFRFDKIRPGNTFDAHRVLHMAGERGVQDAVKERLLRGYMTEGEAIGLPEVLVRLASEAGLDEEKVHAALTTDAYSREVRGDEEEAREIGITGVPFFIFGHKYAVSGAQPAEVLGRVLQRTWDEMPEAPEATFAEGAACGPDGCA